MANLCPICRRDDSIQKVSSIVSSGIATSTFSHRTYIHGTTRTRISTLLAPPPEPREPSVLVGGVALAEKKLGRPIMVIILLVGIVSIIATIGMGLTGGEAVFCSGFALFCIGGAAYNLLARQTGRGYQSYQEALEEWKTQKARWQAAMRTWEGLYYCSRDDIIFNPTDGTKLTPEQLKDYWYE